MAQIQTLKGFRDFFPEDCATRNYVFNTWRQVAARYGFVEFEVPHLEPTDLYKKKSGDEIVAQLFSFTDQGGREVALRPEITPSLAKMVAARQRDFRKPLRWFQIGSCFRYENKQRGRLREFYQFNADIIGEPSPEADAELIALAIDTMRAFGFSSEDFAIRLSDRRAWSHFLAENNIAADLAPQFLQIIDKIDRENPDSISAKLAPLGISLDDVRTFMAQSGGGFQPPFSPPQVAAVSNRRSPSQSGGGLQPPFSPPQADSSLPQILAALDSRGMSDFVQIDLGIVRGLAYYSGAVFEVFAKSPGMRAIAGGGRYDSLISLISDGAADLPAVGFGMGDVVITDLIRESPSANSRLTAHLATSSALDAYVVIADESKRPHATAEVQKLRQAGLKIDFPLSPTKVAKQFQAAEASQCRAAVIFGSEFPTVKIKDLLTRTESEIDVAHSARELSRILTLPESGPLLT